MYVEKFEQDEQNGIKLKDVVTNVDFPDKVSQDMYVSNAFFLLCIECRLRRFVYTWYFPK